MLEEAFYTQPMPITILRLVHKATRPTTFIINTYSTQLYINQNIVFSLTTNIFHLTIATLINVQRLIIHVGIE